MVWNCSSRFEGIGVCLGPSGLRQALAEVKGALTLMEATPRLEALAWSSLAQGDCHEATDVPPGRRRGRGGWYRRHPAGPARARLRAAGQDSPPPSAGLHPGG